MGMEFSAAGLSALPEPGEPQYRLLLTVEEAAQALRVSRSKVYMLLMQKRLFGVKVGAARRIPVKALEEYVDQLMVLERIG
jgi:excisionase family DNA binding protein